MSTALREHCVCIEDKLLIPKRAFTLPGFRSWMRTRSFPEKGRVDFLQGRIELDRAPEDLQAHGVLKGEIFGFLRDAIRSANLGQLFVDGAPITSLDVGLSCKPDVVFISWKSLQEDKVRYSVESVQR